MKDFIDYVAGNDESDLAKVKAERDYALHCLEREIALCHEATLRAEAAEAKLEQIAIVCTDNMDRSCDHRMALDFVRQIANDMGMGE